MSKLIDISQMRRRVITDKKEKELFHEEIKADAAADKEEKERSEQWRRASSMLFGAIGLKPRGMVGWTPPETLQGIDALVQENYPTMPAQVRRERVETLYSRLGLIHAAFQAGLKNGRDLKERSQYGVGWLWDEMDELNPVERTFVIDQLKRVLEITK